MTPRFAFLTAGLLGFLHFTAIGEPVPDQKTIVPPGSLSAGKTLFVEKGCYQCHIADGIKAPASELDINLTIDLGGPEHAGWTRDDFARAIMNPNHTVSDEYRKIMMILGNNFKAENSPMPGFNEMLMVSDLIHLTTFLQSLSE